MDVADHEFICNLISNYFGSKLLTTVEEIFRHRILSGNTDQQLSDDEESQQQEGGSDLD
jgi:hypothetical protein